MWSTTELAELDELVEHLDTQISQLDITDDAESPSLLCSFGCGGGHSWYWNC